MKTAFMFFITFLLILPASAKTTASSGFAEKQYAMQNKLNRVHINVKAEHQTEYHQKICDTEVFVLVYGYGDMKLKECGKYRVTYLALLDRNRNPVWSSVTLFDIYE
jgi:hypothetical protein